MTAKPSLKANVTGQISAEMVAGGLAPADAQHRAECKVRHTRAWWIATAIFALLTLLAAYGSFSVMSKREPTLLLLIGLGIVVLIPLLFALFCASQASAEATRLFLDNAKVLSGIVSALRRAVLGSDAAQPPA